jgi:cholesterol transport system auxiliary component
MESHSDDAARGQDGTAMTNRRKGALRAAFALVGALATGGCGSVRYPAHYILHFEPTAQVPAPTRDLGTLAIKKLRCPDYLCEGRIVYRPTPEEVGFYQYHRWAVSPGAMIEQYLAERVRARSLFVSVSGNESRMATNFVLSGTLEQLEEVDDGRQVAAVCSISAQLVDTRTRAVVWSRMATERVPVEQREVAGVVNGLATAVRASVERLVTDMEFELGRGAVPRDVR